MGQIITLPPTRKALNRRNFLLMFPAAGIAPFAAQAGPDTLSSGRATSFFAAKHSAWLEALRLAEEADDAGRADEAMHQIQIAAQIEDEVHRTTATTLGDLILKAEIVLIAGAIVWEHHDRFKKEASGFLSVALGKA